MGLSLRKLGKGIWETLTPQNEEAQRRADANLQRANQRLLTETPRYGALTRPGATQQFVQQNQAPKFDGFRTTRTSLADALTKPESYDSAPKVNVGSWFGSGLVEDFLNSPIKQAKGAVQIGQGDFKKGIGNVVTGTIEGPAGFLPVGKAAQAGLKGGSRLLPKVVAGAKVGAREGAVFGGAYGGGQAASEGKSAGEILKQGLTSGFVGGVGGGVVGGGLPIAGAGLRQLPKVAAKADNAAFSTKGLRIPLDDQRTLLDYADYKTGAYAPENSMINKLTSDARRIGDKLGIDVNKGNPAQIAERIRSKVDEIEAVRQGGYAKVPGKGGVGKNVNEPPQVGKTKVTAKTKPTVGTNIDPNDPFGNKSLLKRIRNEAGSLVDDDAQMITLLKKVEKQTGRKGLVDQWMFDTGNIRASASIANSKLRNSEDFSGALKGLSKKELKEFDDYVGARAELKNYEGLPTSRTPEVNTAIVAQGDTKFGQRFTDLNNFYKKQAQDLYEGGLISKEKLDYYNASDDYVRIQRDMEDLVNPGFGSSKARSIGSTTANQKRSGSARDIVSPTGTVPKRTQQIQLEIQRNKAASNTLDILEEQGLAKRVDDSKNKNTVSRMVDGQRQVYEVPADIKRVMDNVNPYHLGVISRIVSAPVRLVRAGLTGLSAPFTVTNYLRDQASSALYSKSIIATHNPKNIVSGLASATRDFAGESHSPLWKKFEQFAGDQTIYDELRNTQNTKRLLREVRKGEVGKLGNMVSAPIRTLEDLVSITEKATRFQNFKGIYQKAIKQGLGENEAIKQAVLAARQNSVDFQRSSAFTRVANLFIPYFNAGVQGSRNVVRSFRDRPIATAMKSTGLIIAPSIALTAYNMSDDARRQAYESIDEFEKENNFIIVGPNAKQDETGQWTGIYKIPKPQGYRELTDPARDVAEAFMKNEPVQDVAGMFKDMLGGLTGPVNIQDAGKFRSGLTPQIAKSADKLGANKDYYTGKPIIRDYMLEETDDPTKRAYEDMSGSSTWIAKQLGVSPIQVDMVIKDNLGSLGLYGTNAVDNVLAKTGAIEESKIGGRSAMDDFSRRLFEASGELLDKNKKPGRKYFENVKIVSEGLNKNEMAAFNSLHPSKTNFLGEDIFDENKRISKYTRAGAYLNNPNVLSADRKLDQLQREQGKPGNPLYDLPDPLLRKVLLKDALPPGSKDPELSNLYKEPWYQDYQNARSSYYDKVKAEMAKEGKVMPKSTNPYPETPKDLQKVMDAYSALPKGTGERSNWIKANPGLWQQMTAQWSQVDAWENKERVAIGLAPIEDEDSSGGYGKYGFGPKKPKTAGSAYKYAVSLTAGGQPARPKVSVKKGSSKAVTKKTIATPKVSLKKSLA